MARFTLIERRATGDEVPDPDEMPRHQWIQGEHWLIIERVLLDRRKRQRGTFSVVGHVLQVSSSNVPLMATNATNRITGRGDISTQGLFRFDDKRVVLSIVGGTGDFKKARGTVTIKNGEFTFRVS